MYQIFISGYHLAEVPRGKPYYVYSVEMVHSINGTRHFVEKRYSEFNALHRLVKCIFIFLILHIFYIIKWFFNLKSNSKNIVSIFSILEFNSNFISFFFNFTVEKRKRNCAFSSKTSSKFESKSPWTSTSSFRAIYAKNVKAF